MNLRPDTSTYRAASAVNGRMLKESANSRIFLFPSGLTLLEEPDRLAFLPTAHGKSILVFDVDALAM